MAQGSIKGIPETIIELRAFGGDIEKIIDAESNDIANQVELDAKKLAPKNFGKLAQSISSSKVKMSNYKITVNEYYGAYMEFGTGAKVSVPSEMTDVAAQFRGGKKGNYKEGLEAIKVWCRAKGIDEKFAYVIFAKILGAGVNPQPFLYPAWKKGKKDYLVNLTKLLKAYKKKI